MADCQVNNASSDKLRIPATDDSSILEHITKTIIELNTCRKIVLMYPPEHVQVQRSLKRACDVLNQAMRSQPELIIGVAKDALLVGGKPLDPKNAICKDFAVTLMQHEVAVIRFLSDVTTEELLRFLLLIAEKPDDIQARGGLQKISSDGSLSKIKIQAIDYGKFQFTEEAEIAGAHKDNGHTAKKNNWQNYIVHLLSGTLSESNDGKSLSEFGKADPVEVAELLNRDQIDLNAALGAYQKALKNLADQISTRHCISLPCEGTEENPNPAVFSSAPVGNLQNLNQLLKELNPDLRQQFLAVTFQQCNTEDASNWADEFLGNFSENLVIDMLRQANATGKEISPTLLSFIEKFSRAEMPSPIEIAANVNDPIGDRHPSHNSPENLPGLFQRESYEDFVVTETNTLLNGLTREKQTENSAAKAQPADPNILESMQASRLCDKIAMLLLLFMKTDLDAEKYRAYAAKLIDIGNELLEAGHFSLLLTIMNRFKQHCREQVGKEIQTVAKKSIETWQDPAFTSKAVKTIIGFQDRMDPKAYDFLIALGPQIVPDLINAYGKHKNSEVGEFLFELLTKFKDQAVKEAQKRLRDTRPEYVGNMVGFLRRINAREALPQLRSLMETSNSSVQMAVLATLLKFGDGWASYHLRKSIQSDQADIATRSIAMAAKYKVADIVPDLLAMLKTRVYFKSDYPKNEEIIAALGQIGDTGAIPTLEKLAKKAGLFHQEEQLHMKLGLYASLQGYPLDAVSKLLKIGQHSKEQSIRDVCRKTLTGMNPCSN